MKATIETRAGVRCIVGASGGVLPADIYHVAFFKEAKRLRAEAERLSMELTNYKLGFATQTEAREAADAEVERLSARTCIHHTDAERAAAGCPVCARADADDQARWAKHYLDRAEAAEVLIEKANEAIHGLVMLADLHFDGTGRDRYSNAHYCRGKEWFSHMATWKRDGFAQGGAK
jgi:hypothetical protein